MAIGFDLAGIFLLTIMAVSGLKKGLIDGILKIVGMYAAIYVSMNYSENVLLIIQPLINIPDNYKTIAGYGIAFLATMYSFTLLGFILKKIVKTMNLGIVDRIGGITLGIGKAGLLLSAVVWAFAMVPKDMQGTWQQESKLYPPVEYFAANVVSIFGMEDEMALLQSSVGSLVGGGKNKPSGQVGGDGLNLDLMGLLNEKDGAGKGESGILGKAMESMGDSKQELMNQVLKSAGVEDLIGEDGSSLDLMEHVTNATDAGASRKAKMDKMLEDIEAQAQGRKK